MLSAEQVRVVYGRQIEALKGVSFSVSRGEIVALLGANGAGKTTLLKALAGVQPLAGGEVVYRDQAIGRLPASERVRRGLVLVPEGRRILTRMTVEENLLMGCYPLRQGAWVAEKITEILQIFPNLARHRRSLASVLSGGEQQMLAIGRALMAKPQLLILDEPSLGLAPLMIREVFDIIRGLRASGITILLVEQNAREALRVADRGCVLETGQIVLSGSSQELLGNPQVQAAYLGERKPAQWRG